MKLHIILFDSDKNIALFKNKDAYDLPSCDTLNDEDIITLCDYLKNEFGLDVKKDALELKIKDDENSYYYCHEPYFLKEFKRNLDKITWIKENELKDVLIKINTPHSNKLIEVLTKILRSNFSFSKKERSDLMKKMEEAKESGDTLALNFYFDIAMSRLLNKNNENEIYERYQKKLGKSNGPKKESKKTEYENYIEKLCNTDLIYLTQKEATLIGRFDEWEKKMEDAFKLRYFIPINPNGNNMFLFEAEMKLQGKDDITPNIIYELASKYKGQSYEDAEKDLRKSLKETKKPKKR